MDLGRAGGLPVPLVLSTSTAPSAPTKQPVCALKGLLQQERREAGLGINLSTLQKREQNQHRWQHLIEDTTMSGKTECSALQGSCMTFPVCLEIFSTAQFG